MTRILFFVVIGLYAFACKADKANTVITNNDSQVMAESNADNVVIQVETLAISELTSANTKSEINNESPKKEAVVVSAKEIKITQPKITSAKVVTDDPPKNIPTSPSTENTSNITQEEEVKTNDLKITTPKVRSANPVEV